MIVVSGSQKRALAIATTIAILGGAFFLRHYFLMLVFAAIVSFSFTPLYRRLLRRGQKPGKAAAITLICSLLAIVIPLVLVLVICVHQIIQLVDAIKNSGTSTNLNDLLQRLVNALNSFLSSLHIPYQFSVSTIIANLGNALKTFAEGLLANLKSTLGGFFDFFSTAIIYIFVFLSMIINQDKILETIHQLNPLGRDISKLYTKRVASMTKAMVKGQFIIAAAQGFTDALLLYLAGLHNTFFFFFVLLTALSVIPLGGGIIAMPIGVIMILTGNVWQGVLVIAGHLLIVTNIDNVLRPRLVPKDARLDPALTLLSVFSGIKFFGFLGIVIGPVIMIVIVTTVQVYMEVFRDIESVDKNKYEKHGNKFLNKLKFWKQKAA
ncbi:MAG TPA: AI-2E family transporter [Patescibacteria group bacterium]|nr:AI-2E family transporter [Patescibacteria group bacterium]